MWFIGVKVERETSAPLLKKILDPPLDPYSSLVTSVHLKNLSTNAMAMAKLSFVIPALLGQRPRYF